MTLNPSARIVATMDTKGQEACYIAECFKNDGVSVCLMDAGIRGQSPVPVNVAGTFKANARIKSCLNQSPHHINDPEFTAELFKALTRLIGNR